MGASEPGTFRELLTEAARQHPDKPWLHFADESYTFSQMQRRVYRVANGLRELGVVAGDKVCFYMSNCTEFVVGMFAVTELGAVYVSANFKYKESELQFVVDHCDATTIICQAQNVQTFLNVRSQCPKVRNIVVVGESAGPDTIAFAKLLEYSDACPEGPELSSEDIAAILYTSGTTGRPKGVMLHHGAYVRTGKEWVRHYGWDANSNIICMLPLFHVNAQAYSTMATLSCGAGLFLLEKFSVTEFWDDCRRWKITSFAAMPTVSLMLYNQPPGPMDRTHHLQCISSVVPVGIWEQWEARFGVPIYTGFTLTECMLALLGPTTTKDRKLGSSGRPVPGIEACVVDAEGKEVARNTQGELVLRGWALMKGYYKQPDVTLETLRSGWLHTGDAFRQDDEGDLWFMDRIKDIVRRGGENISSAEVEAAINTMPGVAEAAVVAVRDPVYEEEVKAYIILKDGYAQDQVPPAAIVDWCLQRLAKFKVPRYIEYRTILPRTPTFKVQKAELKKEKADLRVGSWDRIEGQWIR